MAVKKEKEERAAMMAQAKNEIPFVIDIPRGYWLNVVFHRIV